MSDLPQLVDFLKKGDIIKQHEGMIGIRKLMADPNNPPIQ